MGAITEILEQLEFAADERQMSPHTKRAYVRVWRKVLALCEGEGYQVHALPKEKVGEYYTALTRGRSASHHIQVKASLSFLLRILDAQNPFKGCLAPKFNPEAVELNYLPSPDLAKVLLHLHQAGNDYFDKLTAHLAEALFYTSTRFHEWANMRLDKLGRGDGRVDYVRLRVKGGSYRDMPLNTRLAASLSKWLRFLESVKGHRLHEGGLEFAGSDLVFPGRNGAPVDNSAFNKRLTAACKEVGVARITAHGLRHSAATSLLNNGRNLKEIQELLGHKSISTTARYTHVDRGRLRSVVEDLA